MPATREQVENGYRLANERFEAVVSFAGVTIGISHLGHRGESSRQTIALRELPVTLRLATDAPRIDIPDWQFHAGSGEAVAPEADWGTRLGLFKNPTANDAGPRAQR